MKSLRWPITAAVVAVGAWAAVTARNAPLTVPSATSDAKEREATGDRHPPPSYEVDRYRARVRAATLHADVVREARRLAALPAIPAPPPVPPTLRELDYDRYRAIRFRPAHGLWRGDGPFEIQLFHLGSIHEDPVWIHIVEGDSVRALPYDPKSFDFGDESWRGPSDEEPPVSGFAGFRVHYPLNEPEVSDEVLAFLGSSYFRLLGAGQRYGLSARGLAIDPATAGAEEFPVFRAFWIERPSPERHALTIHALLESRSATGAYRFVLRPGVTSRLDVHATVFGRRAVEKLGVAPMSSMFLHAPGLGPPHDDFRPRVHDSDGLLAHTGRGEWIWRPVSNGGGLRVSSLRDVDPRGFGLFQRHRRFEDFLDLEARYDLRPSYWVQVLGDGWGRGGVELLEIPTSSEFEDNIAAYWVPDAPFGAGDERVYRYRLSTLDSAPPLHDLARVDRWAVASDALPGSDPLPSNRRRLVVDFVGGPFLESPGMEVGAEVSTSRGSAEEVTVHPLPGNNGRRVTFRLVTDGDSPADMRVFLQHEDRPVSETWSYAWYP